MECVHGMFVDVENFITHGSFTSHSGGFKVALNGIHIYKVQYYQAKPKSKPSWAEVAVLWQFPTTQHPTPTTHRRGLNEAISARY